MIPVRMSGTPLQPLAEMALERAADCDGCRVVVHDRRGALSRLGSNVLTQQVDRRTLDLTVEVRRGRQSGQATTGVATPEAIAAAVDAAKAAAEHAPPDPRLAPLPEPSEIPARELWHESTATARAEDRVAPMAALADAAKAIGHGRDHGGGNGGGSCSTTSERLGLYTSTGVACETAMTEASIVASATAASGAGWAEASTRDFRALPTSETIARAIAKAVASRDPQPVEAGTYTVVLEPAAVAQLLFFTGLLGLGAKSLEEGSSFITGKLGERVLGSNITIRDDASHAVAPGLPFDFEGRARHTVTLIERGIARSAVHDSKTAAAAGVESTGHALPPGETAGPVPLNLVLDPGDQSLDELIAGTAHGLLVTQLHYVNVVDPRRLLLTGMTRNGTFRITDGTVGPPVKNLRFTQSAVDAFNNVEALGNALSWQRALFGGSFLAPAARIAGFNFTSVTDF